MTQRTEPSDWKDQLRVLVAAADPAPWRVGYADDDMAMGAQYVARGDFDPDSWPDPEQVVAVTLLQSPNLALSDLDGRNANFIAAARDGVPRLLAENDRLLMQRDRTIETLSRVMPEIANQVGEQQQAVHALRSLLNELQTV
jgi:hypothetical protein